MACSINSQTIHNGIVNDITETLLSSGQYLQENGVLVDVLPDKITRLPQKIENSRKGKLKSATNALRGYEENTEKQNELVESWAKSNNSWLDSTELGEQLQGGEESLVYRKGDKVYKIVNNTISTSPLEHLDRITIFNSEVPNAVPITLEGFTSIDDEIRIVISQPFIEGELLTDDEVVENLMVRSGWVSQGNRLYTTDEVILEDVRASNAIMDASGKIQIVDAVATLNTAEDDFGGDEVYRNISSNSTLDRINNEYGYNVVATKNGIIEINIPSELIDSYMENVPETNTIPSVEVDLTEPTTPIQRMKVGHLLTKMGVDVEKLTVNGQPTSIEAMAIPLQALVSYTEGNEQALPEEAYHIAIELLSINHPGLLNKMLTQITSLPIYKEVYDNYSSNPQYQKNGKPDLLKIKKEAIAKQLVLQEQQPESVVNWWDRVKNFLRELFGSTGVNLSPFQEALNTITRGNIGTVRNTLLQSPKYLQSKNISPENTQEIIRLAKSDLSDEMLRLRIAQITPTEVYYSLNVETASTYDKLNGVGKTATESVLTRLTEYIASVIGSDTTQSFKDLVALFKGQKNDTIHQEVKSILSRYINSDGTIRSTPLPKTNSKLPIESYEKLEKSITDKLAEFPNSKVIYGKSFSSDFVTDIDMVVVDQKGVTHIFNFLTNQKPYVNADEKSVIDKLSELNKEVLREGYNISQTGQNRTIIIPFDEATGEITTLNDSEFVTFVPRIDKTGSAKIDSLVANLRQLSNGVRSVEDDRLFSQISSAIHALQTTGEIKALLGVLNTLQFKATDLVTQFEESFSKKDHTDQEITDFANRIDRLERYISTFSGVAVAIEQAAKESESFSVARADLKLLVDRQSKVNTAQERMLSMNNDFIQKYMAAPNGNLNVLSTERIVRWVQRNFYKFSDSVTNATKLLYKVVSGINRATDIEVDEARKTLEKLKEDYDKVADKKNYLGLIAQKDKKGNYIHRLIEKYDRVRFKDELLKAIKNNDTAWVKNNIDFEAYQKWYNEEKEKQFAILDTTVYRTDEDENSKIIEEKKQQFLEKYDITKNVSDKNNKIELFITDKHLSQEYNNLKKNKPAFALWEYIRSINERAYKAGALSRRDAETMIPFVEKSLIEKALTGTRVRGSTNLLRGLLTPEDYAAEMNVDPATGVATERLPFFFTTDISKVQKDGNRDYSNVSQDIFKILPTYLHQTVFADRMRQKESQIRLLGIVEKTKYSSLSDQFNTIDPEGKTVKNNTNFEYYWNFVRMAVYGHRDLDGDADTKIVSLSSDAIKKVNKALGTNIATDNKAINLTVRNVIKTANKLFQLKVLGLNVAIPIANFIGSRLQTTINSGSDFTRQDLSRNQVKSFQNAWTSDREKNVFVGLSDFFQVLYDRGNAGKMSRQLSVSKLTKRDIPEMLMSLQSESEIPVQLVISGAMFDTHMVLNGEIVGIRKFVKDKYPDYYDKSESERKAIDAKIDQEISQLQETKSLSKIASFENGKLIIPGIERQSQTVYDFINKIHAHTKRATGGGNREDMRQINGSLIGGFLMVFKSWMPRLIQNRVQGLTYSEGLQSYEMGRYNAVGGYLTIKLNTMFQDLYGVMIMNDRGIALAKQHFEEQKAKYEERTGQKLDMSQREYIEMHQRLVRNAMKDVMVMASLLGLWSLIGAMQPPEEDESGFYNAVYHMTERFQKEMSFYYNPSEWFNVMDGSLFPALGVVKEYTKVFTETGKTIKYKITGDKELEKKTHLYKAVTKPIPIMNQSGLFFQLFYEDFAKELGYKDLTPEDAK